MKTFFIFLVSTLSFFAGAQSDDAAVAYNDNIVELQNRIGYKMVAFNEKVGEEGSTRESAEVYYQALLNETRKVIKEAEKIGPFDGNVSLRNSAINLFKFYEKVITTDYKRMLDIIYAAEVSDEMYDELAEILAMVTEEEAEYDQAFQSEQVQFAEKYGFELTENELQEEMNEE